MNDILVLRSAMDIMDTATRIVWNNKHALPAGYAWNEDGYVITNTPLPYLRSCVGLRFAFLVGRLGMNEFIRQNLIVLRILNPNIHRVVITSILYSAFKKTGYIIDRNEFTNIVNEVYALTSIPLLDSAFMMWRKTWFSETCAYNTVSKVLRVENSIKIDADRDLMNIDEKYITSAVASFTGFSRHRIDNYWSEKQWNKKLRTLYTLEEAMIELANQGIEDPTRTQLAKVSGLSLATISGAMRDIKMLVDNNSKMLNDNK